VLEGGRIVQSGTPGELAQSSGLYQQASLIQIPDEESMRVLGMEAEATS
jgi:hypothetical protein